MPQQRLPIGGPLLLTLLPFAACSPGEDLAEERPPENDIAAVAPSAPTFSVTGLSGPEAVRYDEEQDVYFISNFNGDASERDGNGFISRVRASDGAMEELEFMTAPGESGLHAPRGMMIVDDTLWVADIDGVHVFHRVSGEHLAFVNMRDFDPGFLNDIAADPDGRLYVSDTGRSRIYLVADGVPTIAIEHEDVGPPNGITWDAEGSRVLIAPWAGGEGIVRAWQPGTSIVERIAPSVGDRVDGIEIFDGQILVAVQSDSSIYSIRDATVHRTIELGGAPADIAIDSRRARVAVPYIALDRVDIWELPR